MSASANGKSLARQGGLFSGPAIGIGFWPRWFRSRRTAHSLPPHDEAELIRRSGLFDAAWYTQCNPDVADYPDAVVHYVARGAHLGKAPHPLFLVDWYCAQNPDVAQSGLSPLGHFIVAGEASGARPHPLFDPHWYRRQAPSLGTKKRGAFRHFLERGGPEGLSPHPLFDVKHYETICPQLSGSNVNRLTHFILTDASERLSPCPFFDAEFYLDGNADVERSGDNALVHFLIIGAAQGRWPHPKIWLHGYQATKPRAPRDPVQAFIYLATRESSDEFFHSNERDAEYKTIEIAIIQQSGLFDAIWYVEHNPDATAFDDPVRHYVNRGAAQGRAPHPLFLTSWYCNENPDAIGMAISPLAHFILIGEARGARPHPLFDPDWYRGQVPSLSGKTHDVFRHFLEHGPAHRLSPHPAFDVQYYDRMRLRSGDPNVNRLTHFVQLGAGERISPTPFFDSDFYLSCNEDVARAGDNPLVHFLIWGAAEGRRPHPGYSLAAYQAARPDVPRRALSAFIYLVEQESPAKFFLPANSWVRPDESLQIEQCGLFDPRVYLSLNPDLAGSTEDAWNHFKRYGLREARPFTNCEVVARRLAGMSDNLETSRLAAHRTATAAVGGRQARSLAGALTARGVKIGVFCSSEGNFFMHEIAELLAWGLRSLGIKTELRTEQDSRDEPFSLRVFVAPHEFFFLGKGLSWVDIVGLPNSVLYNVEQMQTQWFCRAFSHMVRAPLLLDINFQAAAVMRSAGAKAVHFMPGYLADTPYTRPTPDISNIELTKGYGFSQQAHDWTEHDRLEDRPIDILFIGSSAPRRDRLFHRLVELADQYRFVCVYTTQDVPLTAKNYSATSTPINCALAQRSKISLNLHREWVGYFEWSRMVMQGFWQGACVVSDPSMPNPIFRAGEHVLEENAIHLAELVRWLLGAPDGRRKLDETRRAALEQAKKLGAMDVALTPVLEAFCNLLEI